MRQGGVIAYPTEAVYGLGCDPFNRAAVDRLLAFKGRRRDKGLLLIAAEFSQVAGLLEDLQPKVLDRVAVSWPGFVTWVLPVRSQVPGWLTGGRASLAVRVTAHPLAQALCRAYGGPLVSTSANLSGRVPARDSLTVRRYFGTALDYIVPGRVGGAARPSVIRDARTGALVRA
jgi:L-threonylcarbamoyladenylate synthase